MSRPWWQTKACPPWCFDPHMDGDHYEERLHFGPSHDQVPEIDLSLHNPVRIKPIADGLWTYGPPTLFVDLEQHVDSTVPHVKLGIDGALPLLKLTVAEARALAAGLTAMCDLTA